MSRVVCCAIAVLTLVVAPGALAGGPSLGTLEGRGGVTATNGNASYVTALRGSSTTLTALGSRGQLLRTATIAGAWGVPLVTMDGAAGGLSADGRVLVLGDATPARGPLRAHSSFTVLHTKTLAVERTIRLRGDFSFDALSPKGSTLYLIEHVSSQNLTKYRVRAYDLKAGRLMARVIADKRQAGWIMNGYPVTRATSANGGWVYTLYQQGNNYPFVHALDTVHRTAVCIGLPWQWTGNTDAIFHATLQLGSGKLQIAGGAGSSTRFVLNTRTFHVAASGEHTTT